MNSNVEINKSGSINMNETIEKKRILTIEDLNKYIEFKSTRYIDIEVGSRMYIKKLTLLESFFSNFTTFPIDCHYTSKFINKYGIITEDEFLNLSEILKKLFKFDNSYNGLTFKNNKMEINISDYSRSPGHQFIQIRIGD